MVVGEDFKFKIVYNLVSGFILTHEPPWGWLPTLWGGIITSFIHTYQ
jgi:hypothetical protein